MSDLQQKIFETTVDLLDAENLHKEINGFTGGSVIESTIDNLATNQIHILSGLCDPASNHDLVLSLVAELRNLAQGHAQDIAKIIHEDV